MLTMVTDWGVKIEYPADMPAAEAEEIAMEEGRLWAEGKKRLGRVEIRHSPLETGQVDVTTFERSPIKRVRRITGYLSNMENFNDAKREELGQRVTHF